MEVIGGGGVVGGWTATDYWQTGDTNLIQNNDNAGYTYGGIYEGYQWGNSSNIMNNAIVNTLEGSSYQANTQYGNSLSIANSGSVEWFLAGGSWNTDNLVGNAQVDIYNGRYNGYVGGNYGANSGATITGNSNVNVYGGNFTSAKSLNGGSYNGGTVQGSSALNVNLSGANGSTFIPPASAMLSGTVPPGSSLKTGLGRPTDTGSLEIILPANMTAAQKTAFASDTFYGDGAASGGSSGASNLSAVNVYVAPYGNGTGTIGSVYGTYYNNATGTGNGSSLKVTTNMTLGDGLTIAGTVSGSSSSSNYTNGLTTASTGTLNTCNSVNGGNSSNIYIGDTASSNPVTVTGSIINFTSITTQDNTVLNVSGQVLNGLSATAANHGTTYSNFGTFNTGKNSTIAVNNSTLSMALGKLVINLNTTLQTPYLNSTGVINISYLDMYSDASTTGQQPTLHWVPPVNSVASVAPTSNYTGAFWGQQSGFPVLTFTGGSWASKASTAWGQGDNAPNQITPDNIGVDSSQNYAFLADYTPNVTNGQTGANAQYVGYFLPGTVREYVNNATSDSSTTSTWQYDASKFNITSTSTTSGLTAGITAKNPLQPFVPGGQPTLMTAYANVASKTPTADLVLEYPSTTNFTQPNGGVTYNASSGRYVSKISVQTYDSYAGLATPSGAVAVNSSGDTALPYTKTGLPSAMDFSAGTDSVNSKTDDDFLPGANLNGSSSGGVGNYLVTTGADAVKTSVLSANAIIVRSADAISQFMTDGTNADSTLNVSALAKAMKVAGVGLMNNVTVQNMTAVQNAIESPVPATNAYTPVSVQWQGTDGGTQTAQLLIASNNSTSVGPSSVLTASMGVITSTQAAATTSVAPTDATLTSPQPNAISSYLSVEGMTAKSDGTVTNHYNVNFVSATFGTGKFSDGSTTTTDATTFLNAVKAAKNGDKFVNIVFSYTDPTNNNQVVTTGPLELDVADQVLQFGSTPNYIDFGQQHMFTLQAQSINGRIANAIGGSDSNISVVDTRSTKSGWSLTAAMTAPLTNENNSDKNLTDDVSVQSSPASSSVQHLSASSGATALIYNESNSQAVTDNADGINAWNIGTDNGKPGTRQTPWASNAQFQLDTGAGQLWPGNYDGSLTWTLNDVPAN